MDNQILLYRKEIDTLDFQLLDTLALQNKGKEIDALLKKRVAVVQKLAAYKKKHTIPPFDLEREAYIFKTRKAYGKNIGLSEEKVKQFFCDVLLCSHHVIERIFQDKQI